MANVPASTHWQTCKQAGVVCRVCGKSDSCNVSPDGTAFKCWRDSGKVHQFNARKPARQLRRLDEDSKQPKPKPNNRTFLTAADAIAAYRKGKPVATWMYRDESGSDVMMVARWNEADGDKTYRPAGFIGTGWIKADPPTPFPLYRLQELIAADSGELVFVCEGEKASDAAAGIGLVATTSAHGSSQAARSEWAPLAGRDVVILPDNDESGEKYQADVTAILTSLNPPAKVRVLRLPNLPIHGDIVEYLEALDCKEPAELKAGILDLLAQVKPSVPELPGPMLRCMADVEARPIPWLWRGRIPLGRLALLVGSPGLGKSYLTCDLIARLTTRTPWPDGTDGALADALLITAEDDPHDTIRPRLDAHCADVKRVHLLEGVRRRDEKGKLWDAVFTLADVPALESALQTHRDVRLVVIDPVGSFLGSKVDAHRDNDVRAVLAPVAALAAKYGVAVILVMHRKKSGGLTADSLALGSTGFVGLARVVWHLCRDPQDRNRRLLLGGKNNLAADRGGLAFRIQGEPVGRVVWDREAVLLTADELVAEEQGHKRGPSPHVLEDAKNLLRDVLCNGAVRSGYNKDDPKHAEPGTIWAEAKAAGISWSTLNRAKAALKIVAYKQPFSGHWVWELPKPVQDANQVCQPPASKGDLANLDILASLAESNGKEHKRENN